MIDKSRKYNIGNGYKVAIGTDNNELKKCEFSVENDPLPLLMNGRSYEAVEIIKKILTIDEQSAIKLINKERERRQDVKEDMYLTPTNLVNIINTSREEKVKFVPASDDIKSINQITFQEGILAANPDKSASIRFEYDFHWVYFKKSTRADRVIISFPVMRKEKPKKITSYCGYIKIL